MDFKKAIWQWQYTTTVLIGCLLYSMGPFICLKPVQTELGGQVEPNADNFEGVFNVILNWKGGRRRQEGVAFSRLFQSP